MSTEVDSPLTSHPKRVFGIVIAASGACVISFDSLLIRLQTMSPAGILFWRGLFSGVALGVLAVVFSRRAGIAWLTALARDWWPMLALAVLILVGTATLVLAVTHTTVAHTFVIIASAPILTAVLGRLFLGENLALRTWVAGAVVLVGVGVVFSSSFGRGYIQGDLWALVNTIDLALILVVLRRYHQVDTLLTLAVSGFMVAVTALPFGFPVPDTRSFAFAALAGFAILPAGLVLIMFAPRYLPAAEVGLLLLLETILAPIWALIFLGEQPVAQVVLSGGIILGAIAIHLVLDLRGRQAVRVEAPISEVR